MDETKLTVEWVSAHNPISDLITGIESVIDIHTDELTPREVIAALTMIIERQKERGNE